MKILLTGARSFIGSYFQKHYVQKYTFQLFSFLNDDLKTLHVKDVDVVLHLSALVHQPNASKETFEQVNVQNTIDLAMKAKVNGVKHFILMSTIAVYGEKYSSVNENLTCKPVGFYGESKLKAELALQELQDENFIVSIIRPPMVYEKDAPGNIKSLIKLIKAVPILPFANIRNRRSFVFVGNLCALVDKVIETKKSGIFLASDDVPLSTTKLIELIALGMNKKIYLVRLPFFAELLQWMKPSIYKRLYENLEVDNTLTKRVLEFQNPYTTDEGMRLMLHGEKS